MYETSKAALERARRLIPLASQTFSKAYNRWPAEAPHFLSHGKGGRVWDVDGNEYADLVGALLPNVLGYCDPDVDAAIRRQLGKGISFSLPTLLESDLADRLTRHVPCAEMARFGKSGTDVTSAAVRLARAVTGRDHIIMCGYHGWQDWSIGQADTIENRAGVPEKVRALTSVLNPDAAVWPWRGVGAYIVDCSKVSEKVAKRLREHTREWGIPLIFDEVITGFRWHIGGAQAYYGVTPDLACFSKAMGNGMPISAIVGRRDLMKNFDHVFFSGTFFGETLSIAAAIACIDKIERLDCKHLWFLGSQLELPRNENVWLTGYGPCRQLNFKTPAIREAFLTEVIANGILVNTAHNVCFAHTPADIDHVMDAYDRGFRAIDRLLNSKAA